MKVDTALRVEMLKSWINKNAKSFETIGQVYTSELFNFVNEDANVEGQELFIDSLTLELENVTIAEESGEDHLTLSCDYKMPRIHITYETPNDMRGEKYEVDPQMVYRSPYLTFHVTFLNQGKISVEPAVSSEALTIESFCLVNRVESTRVASYFDFGLIDVSKAINDKLTTGADLLVEVLTGNPEFGKTRLSRSLETFETDGTDETLLLTEVGLSEYLDDLVTDENIVETMSYHSKYRDKAIITAFKGRFKELLVNQVANNKSKYIKECVNSGPLFGKNEIVQALSESNLFLTEKDRTIYELRESETFKKIWETVRTSSSFKTFYGEWLDVMKIYIFYRLDDKLMAFLNDPSSDFVKANEEALASEYSDFMF